MNFLSLFAGIGGFDRGLEMAGMTCIGQVEIDDYCNKVLEKHWPNVPRYRDIHDLTVDNCGNLLYIDKKGGVTMANNRDPKYDNAVELYEKGLSIGECAEFYGITRQAMHKILQRRDCKFRSNLKNGEENHFYRGGPISGAKRAGHILEKAIIKGIVQKKIVCEKCGKGPVFKNGRSGVEAHHCDYNKPLDVIWLCKECHHEWHKSNKAKGEKGTPRKQTIDVVCGGVP